MRVSLILLLFGLSLFVIYPAVRSSHCIITGAGLVTGPVVEWCKYWILLATAALAEFAILYQVNIWHSKFLQIYQLTFFSAKWHCWKSYQDIVSSVASCSCC